MSAPDIFISYSREDRTAARYFAECFERCGFSVWWDAALHSGETFDEVIEKELRAAKAVVVLWSPRSVASRWVRAEVTMADRRKKLAPVIIEPCDRPIIFELTHTSDLSNWTGDTSDPAWLSLLRDLRRLIDRTKAAESSAPAKQAAQPAIPERFAGRFKDSDSSASTAAPPKARPAPASRASADDDSQATQFYTKTDRIELFAADEYHCLELISAEKPGQRYVVSPLGLKIGRSAPADVIVSDGRVSRMHCAVDLADDRLRVSDLGSTNGTYVDGERIEGPCFLEIGSELRVGRTCFKHEVRSRAEV